MIITDVPGNFADGTTLVTFHIDPAKPQGPEGFIRADSYSVNPQTGPLTWKPFGEVTLNKSLGGEKGRRCLMGVCAPRSDLSLSAVVSFYRAPGTSVDPNWPNSPFSDPNPRRMDLAPCTHRIIHGGANSEDVFFYPILAQRDANGQILNSDGLLIGGEEFVKGGNYFYTMCVKDNASGKFFICDPEMEIDPVGGGG